MLLLINIIVFSVSVLFIYRANRTLRPTFPYVFFAYFVFFLYIGGMRHFFENGSINIYISYNIALIMFALGVFFAKDSNKYHPRRELKKFQSSQLSHSLGRPGFLSGYIALVAVVVLVSLLFVLLGTLKAGHLPILYLFQGGGEATEVSDVRIEFTHIPGRHYFRQFYAGILPFVSIISLGLFFKFRKNNWRFLAIFLIAFCAFVQLVTTARGPFVEYLIMIFIFCSYYYHRINVGVLVFCLALTMATFFGITAVKFGATTGDEELSTTYERVVNRLTEARARNVNFVYEYFPDYADYTHGKTILGDILSILPGEHKGFASLLPELRGINARNAPIGMVTEMYVNFGRIGIGVFMFIIGYFMQYLQIRFIKRGKDVVPMALGACLMHFLPYAIVMVGMFYTISALTFILAYWLLKLMIKKDRGRTLHYDQSLG